MTSVPGVSAGCEARGEAPAHERAGAIRDERRGRAVRGGRANASGLCVDAGIHRSCFADRGRGVQERLELGWQRCDDADGDRARVPGRSGFHVSAARIGRAAWAHAGSPARVRLR